MDHEHEYGDFVCMYVCTYVGIVVIMHTVTLYMLYVCMYVHRYGHVDHEHGDFPELLADDDLVEVC